VSDRARELLRADVMRDFEPAHPSLETRVFDDLDRGVPRPRRPHRALQAAVVAAVAVLVVAALVAHEVASLGKLPTPAWMPFSLQFPRGGDMFIVDARFVTADTGWVLVQRHVTSGPDALFKTSDGGRHWTEQLYLTDGAIGGMSFWPDGRGQVVWLQAPPGPTPPPSKQVGQPWNEVVFRTSDGGAHWTRTVRPQPPVRVAFALNPDVAWGFATDDPLAAAAAVIDRTVDGGRTWTKVAVVAAPYEGDGPAPQLFFRDASTGWLSVQSSREWGIDAAGNTIERVIATTLIWSTRDGGRTWSPQTLPLPAEALALNVHVEQPVLFGPADGVLPVEAAPLPVGKSASPPTGDVHRYVLRTTDGGATWTSPVEVPPTQPGGELFLTATHWLYADGPNVRETLDGGRTWTSRRVLPGKDPVFLSPFSAVDGLTIVAPFGPSGLSRSVDGGRTWSAVASPQPGQVVPRPTPS